MFSVTFVTWLDTKLKAKNWTRSELATRAGFSHSALSHVYTGKRKPGLDLCIGIAHALELPEEVVLRAAGIISNQPDTDEDFEELKYLFSQMTDEEQDEFLAMGRLKLELRNKRGELRETKQARPAHA